MRNKRLDSARSHAEDVLLDQWLLLLDEARFYSEHGFLHSPIEARTFMLPIETAIAALR